METMSRPTDTSTYMRRALSLAERGRGRVSPNPVVGAVVVKSGRVVGEGWHRALGAPHAEAMAIRRAGRRARGATLYVTLEPCAHAGRTPPCVDGILESGIRRCVVAVRDPHPIVNGRGLRRLRRAGIQVELGLLAAEARRTLGGYWQLHTTGRPRVTLKLAQSLDGRIAPPGGFASGGDGRWITGPSARRTVHRMRALADAIVIGAGTARADDPRLTARGVAASRQPLRVVCDTRLSLPASLRLFRPSLARGTVVACAPRAPLPAARLLENAGVKVWRLEATRTGISPRALVARLGREGCQEVLVEGGARLATSFLAARAVDRLALFTAPKLLGAGSLAWCGSVRGKGRITAQRREGADLFTMIEMER
jgi:diaminohydroxyphosphoribosylaminopyrimidine deaminase/5-amino-6-(5-phosphoribosylamino)uracil reductase